MKRFFLNLFGSKTNRPSQTKRRAFCPRIEALEDRLALSTLNISSTGALTYTASSGVKNDVTVALIAVNGGTAYSIYDAKEFITVTGSTSGVTGNLSHNVLIPSSKVSSIITFNLGDLADTMKVVSTNHPITVNAGRGNDSIFIGSVPTNQNLSTLDGIHGIVTVNGNDQDAGGRDMLFLFDTNTAVSRTYTIGSDSITRTQSSQVKYGGLEYVAVVAGKGNDFIDVLSTSERTIVYVAGNNGDDVFHIGNAGSVAGIAGPLTIDGSAGHDWLDYSAFSTGVTVDLAGHTATGVTSLLQVENAIGGSGDDHFFGDDQNNILVGKGGVDTITGGAGRDILIGGAGGDTLLGGDGEDILVGGSTLYDGNPSLLQFFMKEWESDGLYADRIKDLTGETSGGLNGAYLLNSQNVTTDASVTDTLFGEGDLDWFVCRIESEAQDRVPGDSQRHN